MTDEQRRAIEEARATVERVSRLSDRDDTTIRREVRPDPMVKYRADAEKQEREFAQARAAREREEANEASNTDAWATWVSDQIAAASLHCARELATALKDELDARDTTISKMQREMAQQAVTIARLEVKLCQALVDDGHKAAVDLPNPLPARRRDVN